MPRKTANLEGNIPEADLAHLRELFDSFDMDKDGQISAYDLHHVMHVLGYEDVTEASLYGLIRSIAGRRGSVVRFEDFSSFFYKLMPRVILKPEDFEHAFKALNVMKEGDFLSTRSIDYALKKFGKESTKSDLTAMIKALNRSANDKVTLNDFMMLALDKS